MKPSRLPVFLCPFAFLLALVAVSVACDSDLSSPSVPRLVVEGWIDDDGFPVVLLTTSLPVSADGVKPGGAERFVVTTARVVVDDGEREVVLTGRTDRRYFPSFVYTTGEMRGKAGRTYGLRVEWEGGTATARTVVPAPPPAIELHVEPCAGSDSLCELTATFANPPGEHRYYKVFTRPAAGRTYYRSAFMGAYDGDLLGREARIAVFRGHEPDVKDFTPYFVRGERVEVKIATTSRAAYDFWQSYEDMVSLSRNPLFPVTSNLCGNVDGALGLWCGYGAREFCVEVGERSRDD